MTKTKTEKIAEIQSQIEQLERRQKELIQAQKLQERKDRTKRLCKRAGLLESLLPEIIPLTDEQFKSFLEAVMLSDYSRDTLSEIAMRSNVAEQANIGNSIGTADE